MRMSSTSLKQRIYDELKKKIIDCEYLPGSQINEDILCREFGASRTPVRDALGRLEQEGLVTILYKRGLIINTVSLNSINELFEARQRIEPYAVRLYGCRQLDGVYANYIERFRESVADYQSMCELDAQFHFSFIKASNNRYLTMLYNITADQAKRYRILTAGDTRLETTQKEHYDIAAYCLRRDWIKASQEMSDHLEKSKNAIISIVLENEYSSANIFESKLDSVQK